MDLHPQILKAVAMMAGVSFPDLSPGEARATLREKVALLNPLEVGDGHFGEVAGDLRAHHRRTAAHIGIVRRLVAASEWRKIPSVQGREDPSEDNEDGNDDAPPRNIGRPPFPGFRLDGRVFGNLGLSLAL